MRLVEPDRPLEDSQVIPELAASGACAPGDEYSSGYKYLEFVECIELHSACVGADRGWKHACATAPQRELGDSAPEEGPLNGRPIWHSQ